MAGSLAPQPKGAMASGSPALSAVPREVRPGQALPSFTSTRPYLMGKMGPPVAWMAQALAIWIKSAQVMPKNDKKTSIGCFNKTMLHILMFKAPCAWIFLFEGFQEIHCLGQAGIGSIADLRLVDDGSIGPTAFWKGCDALVKVATVVPGQTHHDGSTVVLIDELEKFGPAIHILIHFPAVAKLTKKT